MSTFGIRVHLLDQRADAGYRQTKTLIPISDLELDVDRFLHSSDFDCCSGKLVKVRTERRTGEKVVVAAFIVNWVVEGEVEEYCLFTSSDAFEAGVG
jgi:hypothetical protein